MRTVTLLGGGGRTRRESKSPWVPLLPQTSFAFGSIPLGLGHGQAFSLRKERFVSLCFSVRDWGAVGLFLQL